MKLGNALLIARFIAIVIVLWLIDFGKLAIILRSINPELIALAFLLELAGFLVWAVKWKFLVDKLEKIRFTTLFLGLMGGNCLNTNVLRARTFGGFGRAMFLRNVTGSRKHANWYATIVMDQTTNGFVFSFPVIFSLLFIFLFLNIPRWLSVVLEMIVLIIFSLAFTASLLRRNIDKTRIIRLFYSTLQRVYNFSLFTFVRNRFGAYNKFEELIELSLEEFAKTSKSILKDGRTLVMNLALSAFMFALIYSKTYIVFKSIGFDISISHLIVSLSLILWITSILPVPGGFGVKELVMISIYAMVGIPVTTAAIVSLIDRAIYMFFVIILSYLAIVFMRIFHIGEAMQ